MKKPQKGSMAERIYFAVGRRGGKPVTALQIAEELWLSRRQVSNSLYRMEAILGLLRSRRLENNDTGYMLAEGAPAPDEPPPQARPGRKQEPDSGTLDFHEDIDSAISAISQVGGRAERYRRALIDIRNTIDNVLAD